MNGNKCPVCGNSIMEYEKNCLQCGWIFAEDVCCRNVLFGTMQLEEYEERYRTFAGQYREQTTEFVTEAEISGEIEEIEETAQPWSANESEEIWDQLWSELFNWSGSRNQMQTEEMRNEKPSVNSEEDVSETAVYEQRNQQMHTPRNLRSVLGSSLRRHYLRTGERKSLVDEICDRIADGSFDDLYIGDYFDVTMTGGEKVRLVLAGFSEAENSHVDKDGNFINYYAVVVPENCFAKKESMDKSFMGLLGMGLAYNDGTNYESSYMYNEVLPGYAARLQHALNNRILRRKDANELQLMNLCHLYGEHEYLNYNGFPLFQLHPKMLESSLGYDGTKKCPYWLSDQVTEGYFLNNESVEVAEHKKLGVRPYFCIG